MYRNVLFSVVIVPLIPRIRSAVQASLAERRRQRYMDEFKDFLFMVSTSIGAGRSMKDAIAESIPSLTSIHGSRCVLAGELSKAYERMEVGRENDVTVLMNLAAASGSEDVYDFVTIYSICKTTGASLITALSRAASVIIDKMTIEREVQELVKRKKSEGMIIFVMPVIVILFLNLCAPDYIAPLYETLAGRLIMTGVIISIAGIYSIIQKIVKIEI
jgi:tight adherence protein B